MFTIARRLTTLRLSDIMNPRVVTVRADASMDEAAKTLREHGISGAPVVNAAGAFLGILSASDFVTRAGRQAGEKAEEIDQRHERMRDLEWGSEWACDPKRMADCVGLYMTPAVQGIAMGSTLLEAAQIICTAHVHRLPVLDASGKLVGMVTSLDIVAALLNAMEEAKQG